MVQPGGTKGLRKDSRPNQQVDVSNGRNRYALFSLWKRRSDKGNKTTEKLETPEVKRKSKLSPKEEIKETGKEEGLGKRVLNFVENVFFTALYQGANLWFNYFSHKWVAGRNAENAINYVKKLNNAKHTSSGIINHLGEHHLESKFAKETVSEYKKLIDLIVENNLDAAVSIKPSQFGFDAEDVENPREFCFKNMQEIVEYAKEKRVFLWFDMERSKYTDFTIETYEKLVNDDQKVGICLQANLKRTDKDLRALIALSRKGLPVKVRLVKGIYPETGDIAYVNNLDIHLAFRNLVKTAFEKSPKSFGIAIGSHHIDIIDEAKILQGSHKKDFFEIQVLKGVRPKLYEKLRRRSDYQNIIEYVPYGRNAFAYSMRRIVENPDFGEMVAGTNLFYKFILRILIKAYTRRHGAIHTHA